ncbi:unnamed protein product [Discosporangium mesarthrocarpum]
MAGLGRRTLYRKSVTDNYLNSFPEPGENEEIALVQAPRGSNIIEASLRQDDYPALAILPTRFRKLIWVKRGDYLIASTSTGDFENSAGEVGKVRHRVEHILNKDQVKHLKKEGLWPEEFSSAAPGGPVNLQRRGCSTKGGVGVSDESCLAQGLGGTGAGGGSDGGRKGVMTAGGGENHAGKPEEACKGGSEDIERGEWESGTDTEEDDLFVNNNRLAMMQLRIDHDDEEDQEDQGEED